MRGKVGRAACATLLLFSACSPTKSSVEQSTPPSHTALGGAAASTTCHPNDEGGTVRIWHSMGGDAALDILDEMVADFERTHAIDVHLRQFDGDVELIAELADTEPADWPGIVNVSEQATRTLLDSKQFLLPSQCDPTAGGDLLPLVRATYTVQDELVAMPFGVSVPVLVFDAAKFRRAGLDPASPPLTLTELLEASATLQSTGASPFGLVLSDGCTNLVLEQYSAKRGVVEGSPDNGRTARAVTVDFATPENVADLTELRDGVHDGHVTYIGPNPSNFDDLVRLTTATGSGAMTVHTAAALGDIIRLVDSGNFPGVELGVGPMPGPGPGSLVGGNALWLHDPGDAAEAGRAWTVIDWLQQPAQLARLAAATGYVPATGSATKERVLLDQWAEHPQMKVAYDQVVDTPVNVATAGVLIGPANDRAFVLFWLCDRIMKDDVVIADALVGASTRVNQLIAEYESQHTGVSIDPSAVSSSTAASAGTLDVGGRVQCITGDDVVGIWVEAENGGSGWAQRTGRDVGMVEYSYTLQSGGRYMLKVGCGGTEAAWGSSSSTPFVQGAVNSFICHDRLGDESGLCEET